MMTLAAAFALGRAEQGLAVVSTLRADGTIQSTLVNAGVLTPPQGDREVLAFVTYGPVKLANLRARPQVTVTFRSGWKWASVEGHATLLGPQDGDVDPDRLRLLLRDIFAAAGGTHDDWDEYDRVMREQGRTAVLVEPARIYGS
jgi:PPOX class probable F420-dependent enzyme